MKKELIFENINNINNRIDSIDKKIYILNSLFSISYVINSEVGIETRAKYSVKDVWETYSFYIRKVLYRMNDVIISLKYVLNLLNKIPPVSNTDAKISFPLGEDCYSLFYDFEDLMISFTRLYDKDYISDIVNYLSKSGASEFRSYLPDVNDVNGLYWKVNLLRNRSAHPGFGFYNSDETYESNERFIDLSSKAWGLVDDKGNISIESMLIDLDKNPIIKRIISDEIKNNRRVNLNKLLFPKKYSLEKGDTFLQFPVFGKFDYCDSLFPLLNSMLDFIESEMLVFMKEIDFSKFKDAQNLSVLYKDEKIELKNIYNFECNEWK